MTCLKLSEILKGWVLQAQLVRGSRAGGLFFLGLVEYVIVSLYFVLWLSVFDFRVLVGFGGFLIEIL